MNWTDEGISRRRAVRISEQLPAKIEVFDSEVDCTFTNFSEFGCFVETHYVLYKDATIRIFVEIEGEETVVLFGRVVSGWYQSPARPTGMGVEFISPSEDYLQFVSETRAAA